MMADASLVLEGQGLCLYRQGRAIVDRVDIRIDIRLDSGGISALVGANGAGKTSLVSLLAGLIAPDSGVRRITGSGGAEARIGLMMQKTGDYAP